MPSWLVRLGGMPASRYWGREVVSPERAKSKSLDARSSASGGREEGSEGGCEAGADAPFVVAVDIGRSCGCDLVRWNRCVRTSLAIVCLRL